MDTILLASSSPRRMTLLSQMGLGYRAVPPQVDESLDSRRLPRAMAEELAQRKAQAVLSFTREAAHNRETNTEWILAADTVVAVGADVMGKPTDRDEAERFLSRLSGVDHHVHTGVALVPPDGDPSDAVLQTATTTVTFAPLSQAERVWYLDTEEWRGVAGGYRIQARGACLIASICGSYSNVVGLPIRLVYSMLASNGFVF